MKKSIILSSVIVALFTVMSLSCMSSASSSLGVSRESESGKDYGSTNPEIEKSTNPIDKTSIGVAKG